MTARMLLIHGAFLNADSWEDFEKFFSDIGFEVMAPEWPRKPVSQGHEGELAGLGVAEIVDHYQRIVEGFEEPPVIVGHSFGGLFAEILLSRGFGVAGVALDPAPPKGVMRIALSEFRVASPALLHLSKRAGVIDLTPGQFDYGFTNTWPDDAEKRSAYERYNVPETGRIFFEGALANFQMDSPVEVDYGKGDRAPLLMTAGEHDHTVPPAVVRSAYEKYRKQSSARTDLVEFAGRSHLLMAGPGWHEVAEYISRWLEQVVPAGAFPEPIGAGARKA